LTSTPKKFFSPFIAMLWSEADVTVWPNVSVPNCSNGSVRRNMKGQLKTLAFSVERRSVAVAVFHGAHLDYTDARQLDSDHKTAEAGVVSCVSWITSSFNVSSVVLEVMEGEKHTQRARL